MTTVIKYSGKYDLDSNSYTNLDIRASNVVFNGNGYTLFGWVHIGNEYHSVKNVKINNLNIQPHSNIYSYSDEMCPVCSGKIFDKKDATVQKTEALVYIHGHQCEILACELNPNKELDSHITISHSCGSIINGLTVPDLKGRSICYMKFDNL